MVEIKIIKNTRSAISAGTWFNYGYGRYNYSIHGDYFMVYKPTYNWGPYPVPYDKTMGFWGP